MADFASVKAKIVAKLEALSVNSETVFSGKVLQRDAKLDSITFDPFVVAVASANESAYASTSENRRIYAFDLKVYMERNNRGEQQAEDDLTEIIDALLDAFDQDYTLTGECLMVNALPSSWGYAESTKEYRVALITIRCKVDFDITP